MSRPDVGHVVGWYICTIVAFVFMLARLVVRWTQFHKFYVDDFLIALSVGGLIATLGIQHYMFDNGMSEMQSATKQETINMMQMIIPGSILYITSLWLIKAAMVIFYKRLADRTRYQTIYNITLGLLAATWATIFFHIIFKCYPPDRLWDLDHPERTCPAYQDKVAFWLMVLLNIFSDVFIICLPISQVVRIKMPFKQKLGVLSIFLLGFLVVISSIIRAIYSSKNEQLITCTVSMIETAIATIASCLPVLRTLFFGSRSRSNTGTGTGSRSRTRTFELSFGQSQSQSQSTHKGATSISAERPTSQWEWQWQRSGGVQSLEDESEDELVKNGNNNGRRTTPRMGIAVTTEYEVGR